MYLIDNFIDKKDWFDIVEKIFNVKGKYDKKKDDILLKSYIENKYGSYLDFAIEQNKIKNIQMKLGFLHEKISRIICNDYIKHKNSIDIKFVKNGITYYFQIKNKQNTLNHNSKRKLLDDINEIYKKEPLSKFFIVTINRWNDEKFYDNYSEINGKTFYNLITDDNNFYENLIQTWNFACTYSNNISEYKKLLALDL